MTLTLEHRPYGPDSTPEEVELLRSQLSVLPGGIILSKEVPVSSKFQIDVVYDRIEELCMTQSCTFIIVDLTASARPNAPARAQLKARNVGLKDKIRHVAIVTGGHTLMTIAAKFVAAVSDISYSVHKTVAEAQGAIARDYE